MVQDQKYQPNEWLKYKYGSSLAISKVVGIVYYKSKGWMYTLTSPASPDKTIFVVEADIIDVIQPA